METDIDNSFMYSTFSNKYNCSKTVDNKDDTNTKKEKITVNLKTIVSPASPVKPAKYLKRILINPTLFKPVRTSGFVSSSTLQICPCSIHFINILAL